MSISAGPQDRQTGRWCDDALLLEGMKAGSTVAFGELYRRHSGRALSAARSVCRDRGAAEEALQDGFESIWNSRATYSEARGPVAPWVISIVRYRAMAIAARRRRPLTEGAGRAGFEAASRPDGVHDEAVAHDDAARLREALTRIPAAQREVIALAFFGQLSHAEIAERLGLPAGTVKGRMRLGLGKMRTQLDRTA